MGEMISFPSNGGSSPGYLALPAAQSAPAVIVLQEWWGLVGHITSVADRLAQAGFIALAPDLYHGVAVDEPDEAKKLLMGLAMDKAALDISGAARYLRTRPDNSGKGVGALGFCMGGSLAIWSATLSGEVTATIGFYPGMAWSRVAPAWKNYEGKAAMIHCSQGDGTSSAVGIQEAISKIEEAGGRAEAFDYPGTAHAFFNNDRPEVYDESASEIAWNRTIKFLKEELF